MTPETVVISLATSLHLYSNSRALFGQNKQFQKNPSIYIQRDQPLIDVKTQSLMKFSFSFISSMSISLMNIFVLKKRKSMNYVNVFNKRCAMIFNQKKHSHSFIYSHVSLCIDQNSFCRYSPSDHLDELVNEIKNLVRI